MPRMFDHRCVAYDGRDGGMLLEVVHHLVDGGVGLLQMLDGRHEPQADALLVGVEEPAARVAVRAVPHDQHRGAFARRAEEPVLDGGCGKLEHFLDAHGHLRGLRPRRAQAALGEQAVGAFRQDDHLGGYLVFARADAAHASTLVAQQLLDGDAADDLAARVLGKLGQPLVERAAQHAVAVAALLP